MAKSIVDSWWAPSSTRKHPAAQYFSKSELEEMTDDDLDAVQKHMRREEAKQFFSKEDLRHGVSDADLDEAADLADQWDRENKPGWAAVAVGVGLGILAGRASKG